jgi:hypothetical protein
MVYPSAGIAVSTGTAWTTSITDNSANWNTAYSLRISSATSPLSITSNVISISQATTSTNGYLSSTDWNTFNGKQSALTNPITGTGTINYHPKFTASGTIGNSLIWDNGTNVGIGNTNTTYKLDVTGTGRFTDNVQLDNTSPIFIANGTSTYYGGLSIRQSGTEKARFAANSVSGAYVYSPTFNGFAILSDTITPFIITTAGNVGIGTTSPGYQLQLSTDSAAKPTSALWTIASDIRIKENIKPYNKGLQELLQINPITYDYNGLGGFKKSIGGVGIIAQEIINILPNSVSSIKAKLNETDNEETDILNFNGHELIYVLVNAIKELEARLKTLENK